MKALKNPCLQVIGVFTLGVILGAAQLIAGGSNSGSGLTSKLDKLVYKNTAEIEPLLELQSPNKQASVDDWYRFALSLNDLDLGERYNNEANATPVLGWYTIIAKNKPQALYKLYNQGKLNDYKFKHLLRYGYLKYWDEYINDVDKILLENNQAVLTMAYNRGVKATRQRVKQAFFKLADNSLGSKDSNTLNIDLLLFAMNSMSDEEKLQVKPMLERGVFHIDPRLLHRLRLTETFKDSSPNKNPTIVSLIERYSKSENFTNHEHTYSDNKILSAYMADATLLGSDNYLETLIDNLETNSNQPTDYFCAACGLALSADGLIAYPLINAAKKSKVNIQRSSKNDGFILSKAGEEL